MALLRNPFQISFSQSENRKGASFAIARECSFTQDLYQPEKAALL